MLLEHPNLRFLPHELEDKKRYARRRLLVNLSRDVACRDHGRSRSGLAEVIRDRKVAGKRIGNLVKALKGDDIRLYHSLRTLPHDYYWMGWDHCDRIVTKQFGFNVRERLVLNRKDTWIPPVWHDTDWFRQSPLSIFHEVHQSEDDPTQIAYNRTMDGVRRNIQTRTKPGKYLNQFFSDVLSESDIKYWAERQLAAATCVATLKFIENDDPDGWVDVYRNGPRSCMAGEDMVKVYAYEGNGLRLAYLETAGEQIVARAIVVDEGYNDSEEKGYVRIYSTEQRWHTAMRQELDKLGYGDQTHLDGIKIAKIGHPNYSGRYVMPYIDQGSCGSQQVSIMSDHILIGGGDYDAATTNGFVPAGETCSCCEGSFDDDDLTETHDGSNVCSDCLDEHYRYAMGARYEEWFDADDCIYCESDRQWYESDSAYRHNVYECQINGDWYKSDDMVKCDIGEHEGDWIHLDEATCDEVSEEWGYCSEFTNVDGKYIHDSYVVTDYTTDHDIDMRFAVRIHLHGSTFSSRAKYLYIHQDNLTAEVILSDFVQCGTLLLPNTYYGNPVTCCTHTNLEYGDEYDGDRIEDVLVADAEERLAEAA